MNEDFANRLPKKRLLKSFRLEVDDDFNDPIISK